MTGLKGRYDFTLDLMPYQPADGGGDMAGILMTAVQEQLGLKLESRKAPVEVLVIDHAERIPTEN